MAAPRNPRIDFNNYVKNNCLAMSGDDLDYNELFYPEIVQDLIEFLRANQNITKVEFTAWMKFKANSNNSGGDELAMGLATLPGLTSITIVNGAMTNLGATALAGLNPTYLNVSQNNIGPDGAIALANMQSLEYLNIENNLVLRQDVIEALASNKKLRHLNLNYCRRSVGANFDLKPFVGNNTLKTLFLNGNELGDEDVICLAQTTLESLSLNNNLISDRGVAALTTIPTLNHLSLGSNSHITDACLEAIAAKTSLTSVNLAYCDKLSSRSAEILSKSTSLIRCELCSLHAKKAQDLEDATLILQMIHRNKQNRQAFFATAFKENTNLPEVIVDLVGGYLDLENETLTLKELFINSVPVYAFLASNSEDLERQLALTHIEEIKGGNAIFLYPNLNPKNPAALTEILACFIVDGAYRTRDGKKLEVSLGNLVFENVGKLTSKNTPNLASIIKEVVDKANLFDQKVKKSKPIKPGM